MCPNRDLIGRVVSDGDAFGALRIALHLTVKAVPKIDFTVTKACVFGAPTKAAIMLASMSSLIHHFASISFLNNSLFKHSFWSPKGFFLERIVSKRIVFLIIVQKRYVF